MAVAGLRLATIATPDHWHVPIGLAAVRAGMAVKSGGEVIWDPKAYKIISPGKLNEQMSHPIRGDWKQS